MIRVSIIGSTGYTGGELLRYLVRHPEVTLTHLTSESYAGQPIHQIHKFLKGKSRLICEKLNIATVAKDSDLVFLGLPHGTAAKTAAEFLAKGVKVIDLSADFRIKDMKVYEKWYGKHPVPSLVKEAVCPNATETIFETLGSSPIRAALQPQQFSPACRSSRATY